MRGGEAIPLSRLGQFSVKGRQGLDCREWLEKELGLKQQVDYCPQEVWGLHGEWKDDASGIFRMEEAKNMFGVKLISQW